MSDVILDISLWPNSEGTLGVNKVAIPDGVTTLWPEGDALVENFVYKDGKLVGLVDTKALIENESRTTVIPYDFVDITVDKRLETLMSFNPGERCKHLNVKYEIYLPKGYKRLEYLESAGTQRIDIPCQPTDDTGFYTDYENLTTAKYQHVLSCSADGSTLIFTPHYNGTGYYFFAAKVLADNSERWNIVGGVAILARKVATFNYLNSKSIEINGVHKYDIPDGLKSYSQAETCLFMYPSSVNQNEGLVGRMYEARVSEGSEIVARYLPCIDPTGAPCMYDIISQEPFYNSGTGDFLYPGAESQVVTSDLDENFYAKKTEHGIHRLYHVPENYTGSKEDYASENGFKQLVEPPMPTEGYWIPQWTETDTQLICNWIETEAPSEQ